MELGGGEGEVELGGGEGEVELGRGGGRGGARRRGRIYAQGRGGYIPKEGVEYMPLGGEGEVKIKTNELRMLIRSRKSSKVKKGNI